MPPVVTKFLAKDELKYLLEQLKTHMVTNQQNLISTTIDDTATDDTTPSTKAAYDAIQAATTKYVKVVGPISAVTPEPNTVYLHRDDDTDPTWGMYLYLESAWVRVGGGVYTTMDTEFDFANASALTEADIDELMNQVFNPTTPVTPTP